jgi:copper homeostasis protein (lipoprotein)
MVRAASNLGALPAAYQGMLPCADCPGITYTLELMPDGSFFLRLAYSGRGQGKTIDDIGRWSYATGSSQIVLHGRATTRYAIKPGGVLRQLDSEGREIESKLNYDLRRTASVPPLEPRLTGLRGMFQYFADSANFTECVSGRRFPVAMEEAYRELESAYLKARPESGAELLVTLDGTIALRPSMDGAGRVRTLIVERYSGVWPGETCGTPLATAELRETYWKLTRLEGGPIIVRAGVREPHLIFHSAGSRVTGFGGCNNLTGTYTASGSDGLTFGPMAATRMACPPGADREAELLQALPRVRHWKIEGQHLEFSDAEGRFIARFEARAL